MDIIKNNTTIVSIVAYISIIISIFFIVNAFWYNGILESANLLNWDAEHYNYIKTNGYKGFRVAFFPLFPLLWKYSGFNVYGIVIANITIYLASFYLIIRMLKINNVFEIVLYLSIPSSIFFYLPYSESIFFLCSSLIIMGFINKRFLLIYLGLFFLILARPAFAVIIPALIITELLTSDDKKGYISRILIYILITLLGISVVAIIQYLDTGNWFEFFTVQKGWGNKLQIPKLPLTSWSGGFIVKVDGVAFLIGVLSGIFLLLLILKSQYIKRLNVSKVVIFSISYISGITLLVLMYRGGSLFSLNRFIFATPFIIVAVNYWLNNNVYLNNRMILKLFGLLIVFWLLFGSYVHIQVMLKYLLLSLYVLLFFLLKSDKKLVRKYSTVTLIVINVFFQIFFYVRFLTGEWVG